jgi:predicted dehydrogenase
MSKLRTAVVGVGYLGRFHADKHHTLDSVEFVGVCDPDEERGLSVARELGRRYFADHHALLGKVDAVTIAASTTAHFELARFFLDNGVHVFVEKPMTRTSEEAAILTELADQRGLKLQIGHVERFNPALVAVRQTLTTVRFIECHRLAPFKGRGADVNVILDLMIHDLDVILSLVNSEVNNVSAVGIPVLTDDVDIANARIEFANGAIANVTASRVSTTAQRRFRVFQPNQYVSIDFGNCEVRRVSKHAEWRERSVPLQEETWNLEKGDALLAETKAFVAAITENKPCEVSGADGVAALKLAEMISAQIERRAAHGAG